MISYEELVAALDRYVARQGGTPESVRAPSSSFAPPPPVAAPSRHEPPTSQASMPPLYDEHHDPDLGARGQHEEDATHVGGSPGAMPPPLAPVFEEAHEDDHSNEIDIGDVLTDDEV
jgi:hypothetical protein